jgi:hypothetical protein
MKRRLGTLLLLVAAICQGQKAQLAEPVRMIWGQAPHNGFTDLVRFHDRWFCVFREGRLQVSRDGALRVITSADGLVWKPAALLVTPGADLRDPKLSVTPGGWLLVNAVQQGERPQSLVWSSGDGREWGDPVPIGNAGMCLWRVAWHLGRAYSMGYSAQGAQPLRLYTSADGSRFTVHADDVRAVAGATEAALLFLANGDALCLLRREGTAPGAELGKSRVPYRGWTWTDLKTAVAGPSLIRLPDERIVMAARIIDTSVRTSLCWLDTEQETLTEFLTLPSGGDSGYPGLVFHEGLLWVSYYSSHEGRAMIYLAKVKLPPVGGEKKPAKRLTFGN